MQTCIHPRRDFDNNLVIACLRASRDSRSWTVRDRDSRCWYCRSSTGELILGVCGLRYYTCTCINTMPGMYVQVLVLMYWSLRFRRRIAAHRSQIVTSDAVGSSNKRKDIQVTTGWPCQNSESCITTGTPLTRFNRLSPFVFRLSPPRLTRVVVPSTLQLQHLIECDPTCLEVSISMGNEHSATRKNKSKHGSSHKQKPATPPSSE